MQELRLVPAPLDRTGGVLDSHDFDVILVSTGMAVGRICACSGSPDWSWGFAFPYTLKAKHPFNGVTQSKESAIAAFKQRWHTP
jgi:hypothetical protein